MNRGRKAFPYCVKQYRAMRPIFADRLAERERLKESIKELGIGLMGQYAKRNNAGLRDLAEIIIGAHC